MESVHVDQIVRPRRFAFVIPAGDRDSLVQAVAMCTVLWGGVYNPIVPVDPEEEMLGLLKEFDPDAVVNLCGEDLSVALKDLFRDRILPESEFASGRNGAGGEIGFGFSMVPILGDVHEREARRSSDEPRLRVLSTESEEWKAWLAVVTGRLGRLADLATDFRDLYLNVLGAEDVAVNPAESVEALAGAVFPIVVTRHGIRAHRVQKSVSSHVVLVGDHTEPRDLVAFWNLRATGRRVWFVPVAEFRRHEGFVRGILKAGHYPINPRVDNRADLQRGPSVSEADFGAVCEWACSLGEGAPGSRSWQPRYGMEMDFYVGDIDACSLEACRGDEVALLDGRTLTPFRALPPPYLEEGGYPAKAHEWSLELRFSGVGRRNDAMLNLPRAPGVEELAQRSLGSMPGDVRLGRSGLVVRQDWLRSMMYVHGTGASDVFEALFHGAGYSTSPSEPGRYAEKIIERMGGSLEFDCRVFKLRGVREAIKELSNGGVLRKHEIQRRVMARSRDGSPSNWRDELYSKMVIRTGQRIGDLSFDHVFDEMIEKRVLRPGLDLRCDECGGRGWYHVSEFGEEFVCRLCFERQRVPFGAAADWQFKADGLFQVRDSVRGSLAVLVALWRLNNHGRLSDGRYSTSIKLKRSVDGREFEVDFVYLRMRAFSTDYELVLGEAKNYDRLKESDVVKMKEVASGFDRAPFLAFATLNESFDEEERSLLRGLADDGSRVIALPREELDPYDLFQRFEGARHKFAVSLSDLSENTVELNLGRS